MFNSATGIIFPFALSIIASVLLYNKFSSDDVPFTSFLLFIGVSMSITAFPVLARILSDRHLLASKVGMTAISAAAVGDAASWVFLALVISIVNSSSSPITSVYILIVGFVFAILMMTVVKKVVNKLMELSSTREDLNLFMIFFTFALILASSWITEAIGIHSIFGAFLTGLIIPNESGFAIKLTEKIEDIISVLFVPLYFAYSGLQTKLSALDSWSVWGMLILVIAMACFTKIFFSAIAARICKLTWRESITLGILMNTKGLVELIVLNIGREAGVIDDRVFVIMVVMAIVTTLITTPAVAALYNPNGDVTSMDDKKSEEILKTQEVPENKLTELKVKSDYNVILCLFHINFVSPMLNLLHIIHPYYNQHDIRQMQIQFNVTALRLTQLDERTSTFLMIADAGGALSRDPIYKFFQSVSMNRVPINWQFAAAKFAEYPDYIIQTARRSKSDLVILPWVPLNLETRQRTLENLLEFWSSGHHKDLIADVYNNTKRSAVAAFIDHGFGHFQTTVYDDHPLLRKRDPTSLTSKMEYEEDRPKVFIPFMGGPDDREALKFVIKLSASKEIIIHILRIRKLDVQINNNNEEQNQITISSMKSNKSNYSNMVYMLPDEEEIKKDEEFLKYVNQYIKTRGKITLEALISNQYNEKDAAKYGIKTMDSSSDPDQLDITEMEDSKKKIKKESNIKKSIIFKMDKDRVEGKDETNATTEKPKSNLPDLLDKSCENTTTSNEDREKVREKQEEQYNTKEKENENNDRAQAFQSISSSNAGSLEADKPPLKPVNEYDEDHYNDNIIFEEVETTDPVKFAIKKCTEYSNHDLIIIGRTGAYRHHHTLKASTIQEILRDVHSNQHTVRSEVQHSTQSNNNNNPLSSLFYRRNNLSKNSINRSIHSQTNLSSEGINKITNDDLKGFRRRQQILLGELGGSLMALKYEVNSSIMVFRTVQNNVYEDKDEFNEIK